MRGEGEFSDSPSILSFVREVSAVWCVFDSPVSNSFHYLTHVEAVCWAVAVCSLFYVVGLVVGGRDD